MCKRRSFYFTTDFTAQIAIPLTHSEGKAQLVHDANWILKAAQSSACQKVGSSTSLDEAGRFGIHSTNQDRGILGLQMHAPPTQDWGLKGRVTRLLLRFGSAHAGTGMRRPGSVSPTARQQWGHLNLSFFT